MPLREPGGGTEPRHGTGSPFNPDVLLDPVLADRIGPVDREVADAICAICADAVHLVFGPELSTVLAANPGRLHQAAPWVRDLARGLHYQSHYGAPPSRTAALLANLSERPLAPEVFKRCVETIDLATVVTLGRLFDSLAPFSPDRRSDNRPVGYTWVSGLELGYRVSLTLELLRLLPADC